MSYQFELNQKPPLIDGIHKVPDDTKFYYVFSYGGCGSTLLSRFLENYGRVKHLHDRYPPNKLEYGGYDNMNSEYRNKELLNGLQVPEHLLKNCTVIYIYKNPIDAIYSRFHIPKHLENIQTSKAIKRYDLIKKRKDLYGIEEFFDNWTTPNPERNYKIICVKYEELFDKQQELLDILDIPYKPELKMIKRETVRNKNEIELEILHEIYKPLIDKMNSKNFIEIV